MSDVTRPHCECHDEPMYHDKARASSWRCAVEKRDLVRRYREQRRKDPEWVAKERIRSREKSRAARADPERRAAENARTRAYYYRTGWIVKRRYVLGKQRERITQQLDLLAEEAAAC